MSATVLFNPENSYELTQVMRSSDTKLHQIFDSVGTQLVNNINSKKAGKGSIKMSFSEYDKITSESSENVLVVNQSGIDGVISDYTDYLISNNNPYGMFWIHYNNIAHANTTALFNKIRNQYFEKLMKMGLISQDEMILPKYRNFRSHDYIQYVGGTEFNQKETLLTNEDYNEMPEEVANFLKKNAGKKLTGVTLKPQSRHKVIKIISTKDNLRNMAPTSLQKYIPNILIDVEKIVLYNRQNKYRVLESPIGLRVSTVYNQSTKRQDITIIDGNTNKTVASFSVGYGEFKNDSSIKDFLLSIDSSPNGKNILNQMTPSYIGSSHTAQGNSIKNVIVGDYNIKANLRPNNQTDIFSSLYTSLTRTSSKLIIIKPVSANVTPNQEVFKGTVNDFNQSVKKESDKTTDPTKPPKEGLEGTYTGQDFLQMDLKSSIFADMGLNKSKQDLKESYELIKDDLSQMGVTSAEMIDTLTPQEVGNLIKKYCK